MLRIGFDAKRAFLNNTGLGNYSRSVICSLAAAYPEHQYVLYTPKAPDNDRTAHLLHNPSMTVVRPRLPLFRSLWRSRLVTGRLVKDGINLYHGLSHELPVGIRRTGIKTVVTIHDLIFLRYPQYYKAADRRIYELKFRYACKHADRIIAISEQTKRDIVHFFGTDAAKIEVVYQSCDQSFAQQHSPEQLSAVRLRYNLPEHFLLNIGTIENRKNLMLPAKALPHLDAGQKLVVIGKATPYATQVKTFLAAHQLTDRVIFLENIPFRDLPAIYQLADVFIYPSEFEGFGIPVLEALNAGVPVIAATGSCLEEAGGPDSLYVDPADDEGLAAAIRRVLNEPGLRSTMVSRGKAYAAAFTEAAHAANLMRVYRAVLGV